MSSHRVQPGIAVQLSRFGRAINQVGEQIHEALYGPPTRDDYVLTASWADEADEPVTHLWSPDPPSVPKGHVWTLPQRQLRRIDGTALAPDRIVIRDLDGNAIDDFSFSDRLCPICGDPIVGGFVWMENGRQVHMACSQMIATIRRNKTEEES
jgi:hypothetical protein